MYVALSMHRKLSPLRFFLQAMEPSLTPRHFVCIPEAIKKMYFIELKLLTSLCIITFFALRGNNVNLATSALKQNSAFFFYYCVSPPIVGSQNRNGHCFLRV